MKLNEHVNVNTEKSVLTDIFTPDEGYGLWRDDEVGDLYLYDEAGGKWLRL